MKSEHDKEVSRQWYKDNKERCRQYQEGRKDILKIYNQQYFKDHKDEARADHLKRNYGLTPEQYNKMFIGQEGKCATCKSEVNYRLHVDHNHETGKIRGLLCKSCNLLLGRINDDESVLLSMIEYIKKDGEGINE